MDHFAVRACVITPNGPVEEEVDFVEIDLPATNAAPSNLRRWLADDFDADAVSNPPEVELDDTNDTESVLQTSGWMTRWKRLKRDGNCYKLDRKATHAPKCKASGSNREDSSLRNSRNLNATRTRLQRGTKKKITLPEFRVDPKGHYKQFVLSAKEETEFSDLRDEPRFLLYHDTESPMMIWAADRNMELLNKADAVIWDGTFYITPKNFEQVWVGMIAVDGWYIPVFYVLMQKRSQNEYERALIAIQRHFVRLGLLEVVQGLEFITDFEMPMRAALKKVLSLSDSQLLGCLYHLCKSWIRKVQELGLQTTCWTPKPSRGPKGQWLHRLCGLPWMTVEECKTAWGELKQVKPAGEDIDKLISYIDNTYMAADALFPPKEWCRPPSDDPVAQRTSNPLEGHHRDLNAKVTVKHPGVVDFIKLLKYAQSKSRTKMNSVDYGEAPPASRSNESRRLLHYQNWKRTPGGITTFDYLEGGGTVWFRVLLFDISCTRKQVVVSDSCRLQLVVRLGFMEGLFIAMPHLRDNIPLGLRISECINDVTSPATKYV
ncbi:hypothetical protein FOL47_002225 [Perkinsus chesapeaki]|uniref:MULE transposase domain-containing protein n=1 Tax=Perkinsus chesapeaki TaxID=330153 RepID=A0A7J6MFA1_PERCH|nr:hypothetical protein FOL47_002225 [Perkinsus chesapeaki]